MSRPRSARAGPSTDGGLRCGCGRLDEPVEQSPLERFCAVLAEHGVEFIIVGGQAEALMGGARVTYDVDLCYRRTPDNLERLATALAGSTSSSGRIEGPGETDEVLTPGVISV